MGVKDQILEQKRELESGKKPYETASFLLLVLLLGYQWFTIANMYLLKWANNSTVFNTGVINLPNFVERFYVLGTNIGNFIAPVIYIVYLALVFVLVWWYCKKRGHAKWTWTLIVLFAPNIFLISPVVLYAAYAFRVYLYRFIKSIMEDFKAYDLDADLAAVEQAEQEKEERLASSKIEKEEVKQEQQEPP